MSTIAFRVVPTPLGYGPGIEIRIDGESLGEEKGVGTL
jgi:hypothetical protein